MPDTAPVAMPGRALWPPLLFRQVCILTGMLGIFALRYPAPALTAFALLLLLYRPPQTSSAGSAPRPFLLLLLGLAFGLGAGFGLLREPSATPSLPAWSMAAITPTPDKDSLYNTGVAVNALVRDSENLTDGRLRLILTNVRPVQEPDSPEAEALPGDLALTWQSPTLDTTPGPGQSLRGVLRIRAVRSMQNPGVWETERYWRDRGVYFRAWAMNDGARRTGGEPITLDGTPSVFWRMREQLRQRVLALVRGDAPSGVQSGVQSDTPLNQGHAVLPALLFGDRSALSVQTLDRVARATLAHSLALSGMHLAFAAALGYALAALLGRLVPTLFLRLTRQKLGMLLALPPSLLYLWLGGAPPSLLRAAFMLLFWAALAWRGRPRALQDGLLWAVFVIVLLNPQTLFDIRLQLSAMAVGAMALTIPLLDRLLHALARVLPPSGMLRALVPFLFFSLTIQVALLPLTINAFNVNGLLFFLNLLWLPVLGFLVMPLAFAGLALTGMSLLFAAAFWPQAAAICFNIAALPCELLFALLSRLDTLALLAAPVALRPAWPAMLGFWLLILCLPFFCAAPAKTGQTLPRRPLVAAALALLLMLVPEVERFADSQKEVVRLRMLDVGQGQALLLEWPGGGRMLLDGGGFPGTFDVGKSIVVPALTDNRPPRLDWIVNTHPDTDHLGGLFYPLATMAVGHFGQRAAPERSASQAAAATDAKLRAVLDAAAVPATSLSKGDVISLTPDLRLEVLHPPKPGSGGTGGRPLSGNNAALVMRLVWQDTPLALLCGDVEKPALRRIRETTEKSGDLAAPVLILPHHGSSSSLDPDFYRAVAPELALVSCGYANQWHFPTQAVRDALAAEGIALESTAERGQITLIWESPVRYTVSVTRR